MHWLYGANFILLLVKLGHQQNEAEQHKEAEKSANYYLDRIEELTNRAQEAEKALAEHSVARTEQNEKVKLFSLLII